MKITWFKRAGWIYTPVSLAGWFIVLLVMALLVHDFIAIDRHSHSVSDTYYNYMPYAFIHCAVYLWIASNTSAQKSSNSNN